MLTLSEPCESVRPSPLGCPCLVHLEEGVHRLVRPKGRKRS